MLANIPKKTLMSKNLTFAAQTRHGTQLNNMRRTLTITAVVIVLVGVGVAAYFYFFMRSASVVVAPVGGVNFPVAEQGEAPTTGTITSRATAATM